MLRLGSLVLTGVLLGVPRALEARTFGVQRAVHVEVSPRSPGLDAFARELERALVESSCTVAADRSDATVVVDVRSAASISDVGGASESVLLTVRDRAGARPLVLCYPAERAAGAARALLDRLRPLSTFES
jgi:hypothetical protein